MKTESSWTVPADQAGMRLDKFLASSERLGSRGRAGDALSKGKVFVNDREATPRDAASRLRPGDVIRLWVDRPGSARRRLGAFEAGDLQILYEDDDLLVVNKPAGLLAVPLERKSGEASAYDRLETHLRPHGKRRRPMVVHRIDRDTSGLVVFAKNARAQETLKEQFRRREPQRMYWAVVYGHPQPAEGAWRDDLTWDSKALLQKRAHPGDPKKKEAVSQYRVLETFGGASLLEIRLATGKRNQIRIQARIHGHVLVGERLYVAASPPPQHIEFPRQALHACRLSFRHPVDGRPLTFEAPLPEDLRGLLARLRRGERGRSD